MAEVIRAPDQILSQKAQPIKKVDKKIIKVIAEMKATLNAQKNPKGVGLAAPQIDYPLRIFITKPYPKSHIQVFINPEITWKSEDMINRSPEREESLPAGRQALEGCLSLPGLWGTVKRRTSLKLRYQTPDGQNHEEVFEGFIATIIQHEMDHLEGHLFTQRVLEQKGKLYKITGKDENDKEIWTEVTI